MLQGSRSMNFGEESCMQNYSDSTYTAEMLLDQFVQALLSELKKTKGRAYLSNKFYNVI